MQNEVIILMLLSNLVLSFFIAYIFISYIKTLEDKKCNCSGDIRRKYLKYYGYFFLFITVATIILIFTGLQTNKLKIINDYLKYSILIVNILAAYVIFEYSNILEESDCKCSDSWKKTFIKYYSYFLIGVMSVIFFCLLMIFISHIVLQEDKYIYFLKYMLRNCSF